MGREKCTLGEGGSREGTRDLGRSPWWGGVSHHKMQHGGAGNLLVVEE
jgi:hypothetical protein